MTTDNKTSALIEQQFPDFVRTDGPNLVAFLRAYYEWMEQANNAIETSKNLLNYQDLDTTYDKYMEFFHREILGSIPRNVIIDRALLAKHVKDLWRAKGSESSFRLLFRILYDEEIEFFYPGEFILRASDGRWVKENSIRVSAPRTGDLNDCKTIEGSISGATAVINKIQGAIEYGLFVDELFLNDIVGTFEDNELITCTTNNSITATIYNSSGGLDNINLTDGGAYHQKGDRVNLIATTGSGSGANGQISTVTSTSAIEFFLDDGGTGYTLNSDITITGIGSGAVFTIDSISNTEIISIYSDVITPMASVVINTGPLFVSAGANTTSVSANLASANVSSALNASFATSNTTVGTISAISTTLVGSGYSILPTISVRQDNIADLQLDDGAGGIKGLNAVIHANNVAGVIESINVDNPGAAYSKFQPLTVVNTTRSGTTNAAGTPIITGIINYAGKYVDTKGWLSWNNRLQDNLYWQEYSYELKTDQLVNTYREIVKNVLHPAGTKMFGRYRMYANVEPTIVTTSASEADTLSVMIEQTLQPNTVVHAPAQANSVLVFRDFNFAEDLALSSDWTVTRASNATYFDSNGVLQTALANAPQFNHYFDGSSWISEGVQIEPVATNNALRSNTFSNTSVYTAIGTPTIANDQTGPDGVANSAWTITDNDAASSEGFRQSIVIADDSTSWTYSIFVKKTTVATVFPNFKLWIRGGGITEVEASGTLNTNAGSLTERSGFVFDNYEIRDHDGWWRVEFTLANNSQGNTDLRVYVYAAAETSASPVGLAQNSPTGSSVIYEIQAENTAFATSPIRTHGAATARAATVITMESVPWLDANTQLWAADYRMYHGNPGGSTNYNVFCLEKDSNTRLILRATNGAPTQFTYTDDAGSTVWTTGIGTNAANTDYKAVLYMDSAGAKATRNANNIVANTAFTPVTGFVRLRLGQNVGGGQYMNGAIKRLRYWDRQFANSVYQELSSTGGAG